jgi:hypothetical protein
MTERLPATVKAAMSGADVLVVRRNHQVARDAMNTHQRIITSLGHGVTFSTTHGQMQIRFLSGGRITYMSAHGADERVRGMSVDVIDDAGWLDDHTRALIQKRPTLSNGATS